MLQVVPQQRILLACDPVDFRKGIDGLVAVCKGVLKQDPFSGCIFLFRNRSMTAVKLIIYDGQGFWLCLKRLSSGKLRWWPKRPQDACCQSLKAPELMTLLYNGDPLKAKFGPEWRAVGPA